MITVNDLAFQFKGDRKYIHGTDMIAGLLAIVEREFGGAPDELSGSFHGLLQSQGAARIYASDETVEIIDPLAKFGFSINGQKYRARISATDTEITSSYPYDEDDVLSASMIDGKTIEMECREEYTFIEQIVALTKKLHHTVYSDIKDRWLFTKIQLKSHVTVADYQGKIIAVKALRNLGARLSQCEIRVDDNAIGQIFFTAQRKGK